MKILITGQNGQLGSELQDLATNFPNDQFTFVDRTQMDLSQLKQIIEVLDREQPDLIINAGAYTAVDKAESEPELADKINHLAVATFGKWAAAHKARIIHISTDYVFDGNSELPLKETDPTAPINIYGQTKRLGEEALIASGAAYIIIRTAWVYSTYGANFVKTMLRLMHERAEIGVVKDQIGSPTYAKDLATAILKIAHSANWESGIYHYSNEGTISWFDFAVAIRELRGLSCDVKPIGSDAIPTPAKRPNYSLLDKTKIKTVFDVTVPDWKQSLEYMLQQN